MDLYVEVNHGPYVVDNNIFLSPNTLRDWSQGGTFVHNLLLGRITREGAGRQTPYHKPHSTEVAGLSSIGRKDDRFYNNIIAGGTGLEAYKNVKFPMYVDGNLYLKEAKPYPGETNYIERPEFDPKVKLVEKKWRCLSAYHLACGEDGLES